MGNCWVVSSLGLQPGVWVKMTQMSRREECAGTWGPLRQRMKLIRGHAPLPTPSSCSSQHRAPRQWQNTQPLEGSSRWQLDVNLPSTQDQLPGPMDGGMAELCLSCSMRTSRRGSTLPPDLQIRKIYYSLTEKGCDH